MYKILANVGFKSKLIHYLPSCHSTNEIANQLLGEEGTIIITDSQTNGKGQRGNTWESEANKNLTFSLVLRPSFLAIPNQFKLTQVISLGIANALQARLSKKVRIKWPNDIYVDNKKIGGILIQNTIKGNKIEHTIIGIGLNVNQEEFKIGTAVSLKKLTGQEFSLNKILNEVISDLYLHYTLLTQREYKRLDADYANILFQLNELKKYEAEGEFIGKIIGVDPLGRLLMETDDGVKCFQNQEVKFII